MIKIAWASRSFNALSINRIRGVAHCLSNQPPVGSGLLFQFGPMQMEGHVVGVRCHNFNGVCNSARYDWTPEQSADGLCLFVSETGPASIFPSVNVEPRQELNAPAFL